MGGDKRPISDSEQLQASCHRHDRNSHPPRVNKLPQNYHRKRLLNQMVGNYVSYRRMRTLKTTIPQINIIFGLLYLYRNEFSTSRSKMINNGDPLRVAICSRVACSTSGLIRYIGIASFSNPGILYCFKVETGRIIFRKFFPGTRLLITLHAGDALGGKKTPSK